MMDREALEMWADSCDKTIREAAQAGVQALNDRDELQARLERIHAFVTNYSWAAPQEHLNRIAAIAKGKS